MDRLPHELAEPLRIIPMWIKYSLKIFLIILIIIFLWKYFRPLYENYIKPFMEKYFNKNKSIGDDTVLENNSTINIGKRINLIKRKYNESKEYRKGIFDISSNVKSYYESKTGYSIEEMTAYEIDEIFVSPDQGEFFFKLEEIVFQKKEPGRKDFKDICSRAITVTGKKHKTF